MCACVYESSEASAYSFGLATNLNPTRARSYPLNINPKPDPKPESISGPAGSGLVADLYRRVETPSPDGPADLETFRTRTGRPVRVPRDVSLPVVLLPDRRNTRHGRTGTQLAAGPSQVCISPSEPSRRHWPFYWPTRTWFPELMLLVTAPPCQIPLRKDLLTQRRDTLWHPHSDLWKLHVWSLDGMRRF